MRTYLTYIAVAVVAAAVISLPATVLAAPALPPTGPAPHSESATDAPTYRAIELQRTITDSQGEQAGVDSRIAVTGGLVAQQTSFLDKATSDLANAQAVYNDRVVAMYESGDYDLFAILLDSSSFTDLVARVELMTRILEADQATLEEVSVVAAQAQYQSGQLETLRARQTTLAGLKNQLATSLSAAQTEQQALLPTLPAKSQTLIDTMQTRAASYRNAWRIASVPVGSTARRVTARVRPYSAGYVSARYHYTTYKTTGVKFTAVSSWYGADFNGRETASGELFNASDFTCAHASLPIGTWLAISRVDPATNTTKRAVVVVNDRGPYVDGQDLQLSQAAADAIGLTTVGVGSVNVEVVKPVS
jgi:rare lipoprotein A (peptidoglycan hydrolase)